MSFVSASPRLALRLLLDMIDGPESGTFSVDAMELPIGTGCSGCRRAAHNSRRAATRFFLLPFNLLRLLVFRKLCSSPSVSRPKPKGLLGRGIE
ncbi:hypothetical protein MPTK1_4g09360 [Marchantia polymorpha subsp. ruderalis]|uniref:Uncharacterized protein n=2 Tax=Marchantia polymorpha TaxID=3197 RepID=A0AAF6B829_MARPO|nr:hypothetical protein MARPO_0112s0036 [Marchantia polymorpha]BBN08163.1 hypothetical protein Mp_4g09360 [Marchantia polymorpha subsp. ruderalis]|eukprot:PTQ31388.1 hypothetical protein MARPO_0112s0036 [Marchantia polymorpha]